MTNPFEERLAAYRAQKAAETAGPEHDSELVPEPSVHLRPEDQQLRQILDRVGIAEAYRRWCGKSKVREGHRTESIKVSCPRPGHEDKDPSAWLNTEKQVYNCGVCCEGGDKYDIAAYKFGYPVPGYKTQPGAFRALQEAMGYDLGYAKVTSGGSSTWERAEPTSVQPEPAGPTGDGPPQTPTEGTEPPKPGLGVGADSSAGPHPTRLTVVPILPEDDETEYVLFPAIDWEALVPPETFLRTWMETVTVDDVPEEYHFWNGLLALGLAVGRGVVLSDSNPVFGNLFICILGHSGDGKTQSMGHLSRLLTEALPYKHADPTNLGVRRVGTPASAEALIHSFARPIHDPVDPKVVSFLAPVRGLVNFNEFSALSGRADRRGNTIKPALIELYDMDEVVSTVSMTHGHNEARLPFASVTTSTQPKSFRDLVHQSDVDSGFLNRWLFVGGVVKRRSALGGVPVDVSVCSPALRAVHAWAGRQRVLTWEPDAVTLFEELYHERVYPDKRSDETGLLVRTDLTLKKLALLLTVNLRAERVPAEVVETLTPLYDYLLRCYSISSEAISNTLEQEIRGKILRYCRLMQEKRGQSASIRDLRGSMGRKKYSMERVLKTLQFMIQLGELEERKTPAGSVGRPTVRYHAVD